MWFLSKIKCQHENFGTENFAFINNIIIFGNSDGILFASIVNTFLNANLKSADDFEIKFSCKESLENMA
jgi:hypothetical protein